MAYWNRPRRLVGSAEGAEDLLPLLLRKHAGEGRVLPELDRLGILRGQRLEDGARISGDPSCHFVSHWVIDQLGAEVVAAARDERPPRRDLARRERRRWTSSNGLDHRLGVNQFFIDLAGHARIHPDTQLTQWLPEMACRDGSAFASPDLPALVRAYQPRVRPDGYGAWADSGREVPFFLEYDTGGEQLTAKLAGYRDLFVEVGQAWPVLFWLHSIARERNLRQRLEQIQRSGPS